LVTQLVIKKHEISQQVLFHNFHFIFDSNKQGRNHGEQDKIFELI